MDMLYILIVAVIILLICPKAIFGFLTLVSALVTLIWIYFAFGDGIIAFLLVLLTFMLIGVICYLRIMVGRRG